jgi:hypothetical protein
MRYESAVSLIEELRSTAAPPPPQRRQGPTWIQSARFTSAAIAFPTFRIMALAAGGVLASHSPVPIGVRRRLASRVITPGALTVLSQPALGIARGAGPEDFRLAIRLQFRTPQAEAAVEHITAHAKDEVDVEHIGLLKAYAVGIGASVGRLRPIPVTGTLACFVDRVGSSGPEMLSCNHVFAGLRRGKPGDPVLSPGPDDGGTAGEAIGRLSKILAVDPLKANSFDAALAVVDENVIRDAALLSGGQRLTGLHPEPIRPGPLVAKTGRATGATAGELRAVGVGPLAIDYSHIGGGLYTFEGLLEVRSNQPRAFSSPGDSGALIWETATGAALGLLIAGPAQADTVDGPTFATPLPGTMKELGATLRLS